MAVTKIGDISENMKNIEVTGTITNLSERRRVNTRYGLADVAKADLEDETGSIRINLWRDQIDCVAEGKMVKVINGFAKTYQERLELNIGKNGQISVIEGT